MPRYIDADEVKKRKVMAITLIGIEDVVTVSDINELPDADVAPVVRCKDCKYYSGAQDKDGYFTAIGYCNHTSHHIMPLRFDFYCADGEKMEDING